MKFLPLVWAALMRKPLRTTLTFLSAIAAFMLFGMMLGLNASVRHVIEVARLDCIYVEGRFGDELPIAQREQLLKLPHVVKVGYWGWLNGYYRDPKNSVGALMLDREEPHIWSELPISDDQFRELRRVRTGLFVSQAAATRLGVKAGDNLPILTAKPSRSDGANFWPMKVLGIFHDLPTDPEGLIIGDYMYFEESSLLSERGKVNDFEVLVDDPANAVLVAKSIDRLFANSSNPTRSIPEKSLYESTTLSGIGVSDIGFITTATAAAGLFMMLFLIGNAIAQSVRERIPEFAVMKAVGYSNMAVVSLVWIEAAVPTTVGAAIGLLLAGSVSPLWPLFIPASWAIPIPMISPAVAGLAIFFAFVAAGLSALGPSLRLKRLNLVAALAGRL